MSYERDEELIEIWLELYEVKDYHIHDSMVDVGRMVKLNGLYKPKLTRLPIKFRHCYASFMAEDAGLTSFENFPEFVQDNLEVSRNPISSFEGIPRSIGNICALEKTNITSLVGIADHIDSVKLITVHVGQITEGGLGLLMIDNFVGIVNNTSSSQINERAVWTIINKHAKTKDIFACQQELIENGYSAFAVL